MKLSVAYTFEPGIIPSLAAFPEVKELFAKLPFDVIGGGRSAITLRGASQRTLARSVSEAHRHGIAFNYLLNGASLYGIEQTRRGQAAIRRRLDTLADVGVDALTIASPYLLRLVKKQYPRFRVRAGAFALIDTPQKVRLWEDLGADAICLSAIACNRDFETLSAMKRASRGELQLIVNASCTLSCVWEPTHMHLLTRSSMRGHGGAAYCLDYCFLNCSSARLKDQTLFLRATWIRPEDLHCYEEIGFDSFKIVERSCPGPLLLKRVSAYVHRKFDGNLLEIAGPVANIKREQGAPLGQRLMMIARMLKPWRVKISTLADMKRYAEAAILHQYDKGVAPVYIDNAALSGFLEGMRNRNCTGKDCTGCGYCLSWAEKTVTLDESYRRETLALAGKLDNGLVTSSHWLPASRPKR